jgi:hypothetical protein
MIIVFQSKVIWSRLILSHIITSSIYPFIVWFFLTGLTKWNYFLAISFLIVWLINFLGVFFWRSIYITKIELDSENLYLYYYDKLKKKQFSIDRKKLVISKKKWKYEFYYLLFESYDPTFKIRQVPFLDWNSLAIDKVYVTLLGSNPH